MGYAGFKDADLLQRTNISPATLRRLVSLTHPRGAEIETLWQVADACSIPRSFMEFGFSIYDDAERSLAERLDRLEKAVSRLAGLDWDQRETDLAQVLERWLAQDGSRHATGTPGSATRGAT